MSSDISDICTPTSDDRCPTANVDESGATANPNEISEANRNFRKRRASMGANISHQAYQRKTLMFTSSPKRPLRDEEFHAVSDRISQSKSKEGPV